MEQKRVRFAHLADCHLGGWRQEELQALNFKSFQIIINKIIEEKLDFVLISGDLFDSAYPPIEILKETFAEFRKLKKAKIPVYLIAGSHDFSASGKTFLDVLEKAGFCKNTSQYETLEDGTIILKPTFHNDIAIYGYPGRKSSMEIYDLRKIKLESNIHPFTILMIHTTIKDVVGSLPIESIEKEKLPLANYYAMGHIHKKFEDHISDSRYVYPGPGFPNNFQELSDLKHGSFQITEVEGKTITTKNITIPIKEVTTVSLQVTNALTATQEIIDYLDKLNLKDKIVLLKLSGTLTSGKTGDIRFTEIEEFIRKKGAYTSLRNISSIKIQDLDLGISRKSEDIEEMEEQETEKFIKNNPSDLNEYLQPLMSTLIIEKNEDEKIAAYEERLLSEIKTILKEFEI
jgi:exonuclease SbcD